MTNQRARIYAACAVKLDEDHTDVAEGTFDAALTNALVVIVAHEWPGQEMETPKKGSGRPFLKSASKLLNVIKEKAGEGDKAEPVPDEPEMYLIPDPFPVDEERPTTVSEEDSILSYEPPPLPRLDTRIDAATLRDALDATQPIRHGKEGEGRPLERRHVDALLALNSHTSLLALSAEQEERYEQGASKEDDRERARALKTLELLGEDVARRRAAEAPEIHVGYHPDDPDGLDLQECPVCDYTAFSARSGDELGMGVGVGECLVCHYRRSPAIALAEARVVLYEARFADD
ncbi:hypothetical protein [Streptomyces olivaceiscleroticus]